MSHHYEKGDAGADGGGQSRPVDAHVAGEHEEVIAEDIENAARQHAECRKSRVFVVPQKGRQHLIEQEKREHIFDGLHIRLRQHKQGAISAKEGQDRAFKAENADPCHKGQEHRADNRSGEIPVFTAVTLFAFAALGAEEHTAAYPHQQSQAVKDVPDGCNDRQRRGSLRPWYCPTIAVSTIE